MTLGWPGLHVLWDKVKQSQPSALHLPAEGSSHPHEEWFPASFPRMSPFPQCIKGDFPSTYLQSQWGPPAGASLHIHVDWFKLVVKADQAMAWSI